MEIIRDILIRELGINPDRIWFYNADTDLPTDSDLFIVLHIIRRQPYSNNVRYIDGVEHQYTNIADSIRIHLCSRDTSARETTNKAILALGSTYSRRKQEENGIHISKIGNILDVSNLEKTARLNRFDIEIKVLYVEENIKSVDYYDRFNVTTTIEQ